MSFQNTKQLNMFNYLISRIKDYIVLDDDEIQRIESLFVQEQYCKNDVILKEGEACRKFFLSQRACCDYQKG